MKRSFGIVVKCVGARARVCVHSSLVTRYNQEHDDNQIRRQGICISFLLVFLCIFEHFLALEFSFLICKMRVLK